jgi:hypothetical protein
MHTRLLCATKRRSGSSECGNIALRLFASSSLDATGKVSGRNAARAQVRARDAVDAYSPLVGFSGSLSGRVAPIGGTASFTDGSASFGAAAASTVAG